MPTPEPVKRSLHAAWKPTLLAVDDCPDILAIRRVLLSAMGFDVITCDGAREGLACLQDHHVDLIVTDYNMPGVDGLCMAKQARANGFTGPILMATASDNVCSPGRRWVDRVIPKAGPPHRLVESIYELMPVNVPTQGLERCAA